MSQIKILIVEDEMIIAEDMRDMLDEMGYQVVGVTGQISEAKRLLASAAPDIALLDITLGVAQGGLTLGAYIRENYHMPLVFCTSHADKGTINKAKSIRPNGYLVKPFEQKDLYTSIEIALANFSNEFRTSQDPVIEKTSDLVIKDAIFVKSGQMFVKVKFKDITWLTPEGNYTQIHVIQGGKHLIRIPLKAMTCLLPDQKFFRTHRSFIVNLEHVDGIKPQGVLVGASEIPIGKNFREALLNKINMMR